MMLSYSLSLPFESLQRRYITEASTLAGEKVLGSFNRLMTLRRIVLQRKTDRHSSLNLSTFPGASQSKASPDVLGGIPSFARQLAALGVIHWGVQDGDTKISVFVDIWMPDLSQELDGGLGVGEVDVRLAGRQEDVALSSNQNIEARQV